MQAGVHRTPILENDAVLVARVTYDPSAKEELHAHPFSAVVVQLTKGQVEMTFGKDKTPADLAPGFSWFIAKDSPHSAANVGKAPFDVVTVGLKASPHDYPPEAQAPAVPQGITRTAFMDNKETRVVRVRFEPGAREVEHQHPFDLIVIQLTPGTVEFKIGAETKRSNATPGAVLFFPKEVPHLVANVGSSAFDVLSVAIK